MGSGYYTGEQGDLMLDGDQNGGTTTPLFVITVRSTSYLVIVCIFLDTSRSSFGCKLLVKGNIEYGICIWSSLEDTNSAN